jgi:uncharacterized protein
VLSATTAQQLDERLYRYRKATGHQILVWIGELPADEAVESFSARAFQAWKAGRSGQDDAAVVFFFPRARKVRIEVGYGLEGQLTDLVAGRIVNEQVIPHLRGGDWNGGVSAAVDGVLGALGGEVSDGQARRAVEPVRQPLQLWQLILLGIVGVIVLAFAVTHPWLAANLLFSIMSGGGGGFSGRGGSGFDPDRQFRGEGGRSGGGGATGSW